MDRGFDDAAVSGDPHDLAADVARAAGVDGGAGGGRARGRGGGRRCRAGRRWRLALPLLATGRVVVEHPQAERRRPTPGSPTGSNGCATVAAAAIGIEPPELVQIRRITPTGAAMALGALVAVGALLVDVGDPVDVVDTMRNAELELDRAGDRGRVRRQRRVRRSRCRDRAHPIAPRSHDRAPGGDVVLEPGHPGDRWTGHAGALPAEARGRPALGGRRRRGAQRLRRRSSQRSGASGSRCWSSPRTSTCRSSRPMACSCSSRGGSAGRPRRARLARRASHACAPGSLPPLSRATRTMVDSLRSPGRARAAVGGNVAATIMSTWCLQLCLIAFGGHVSFWALLAANVGVVTIASIVPVPGGGTAVGTVGLSAVLVSFGVPQGRRGGEPCSPTSSSSTTCRRCPAGSRPAYLVRRDYL